MKVALILLAALGVTSGSLGFLEGMRYRSRFMATRSHTDILQQFIKFIPFEKCQMIVKKYLAEYPDVQQASAFLQSEEFANMYLTVKNTPEYKEFSQYLYYSGIDVMTLEDIVKKMLRPPPVAEPSSRNNRIIRESGVILMIQEILGVIPITEIKEWFITRSLVDPDFQGFVARIRSPEFERLMYLLHNSQEYKHMTDMMRQEGIDVEEIETVIVDYMHGRRKGLRNIIDLLNQFTVDDEEKEYILHQQGIDKKVIQDSFKGIKIGLRNLNDLLDQFVAMIPFDKVNAVVKDYLANDPDVQHAYAFLMSDEYKGLVEQVKAMPEFKEFRQYLIDSGVDVDYCFKIIDRMFGLPTFAMRMHFASTESGIIRMISDILSVLPIDKMKDWFYNVCLPNPEFQTFLVRIRSPKFKKLLDLVYNSQEYKDLTDILRQQGIDVEAVEEVIRDFFNGIRIGHQNFDNDNLRQQGIDVEAVDGIIRGFFNGIGIGHQNFDNEEKGSILRQQGIDVEENEKNIRDYLNGVKIGFLNLNDLLKQFADMIPFDKIQAIADKYRANDPEVQHVYAFLMSDEYNGLVKKVKATPEFKEFRQYLIDSGMEVDYWVKILDQILGFPTFAMRRNFASAESGIVRMISDILAVLPINKIKGWFYYVCLPNPEFQTFLVRIRSPTFKKLLDFVYNSQEYKDLTDILRQQGIDVEAVEEVIRDFFNGIRIGHHNFDNEENESIF